MRTAILALIVAVSPAPLTAQQAAAIQPPPAKAGTTQTPAQPSPTPVAAEAPESATVRLSAEATDSIKELIARFRRDPEAVALPANEQIAMGGRSIAAGSQVAGPVAVAGGALHVFGTINGALAAIPGF